MVTLKYRRASFLRAWVQELKGCDWDFPGGPEVQTSPSNAGGVGSIPDWGTKILSLIHI